MLGLGLRHERVPLPELRNALARREALQVEVALLVPLLDPALQIRLPDERVGKDDLPRSVVRNATALPQDCQEGIARRRRVPILEAPVVRGAVEYGRCEQLRLAVALAFSLLRLSPGLLHHLHRGLLRLLEDFNAL